MILNLDFKLMIIQRHVIRKWYRMELQEWQIDRYSYIIYWIVQLSMILDDPVTRIVSKAFN